MKDYLVPSDATGLEEKLHNGFIKRFYHKYVHPNYVIRCHDVFIEHDGKILVVTRDEVAPGIGLQWPIGGYITRGMHTEDSLVKRVEKECGLDIYDISFMGTGRTFFGTDPAGHGFGTDSLNLVYFARAKNKNVTIKEAGHKKPEWINEDH
ncbi:MAG: hypothetical protein KKF44_00030, partial [Nanoarchaeota archaeon]|nr:hypothetical protein [Nanoarchaeota archaeon]